MWFVGKRRWLNAAIVFLAAFISLPPSIDQGGQNRAVAASPQASLGYGIITSEQRYNVVQALGFNWVKINLSWKMVQGTRGGPYNWSSFDASVDAARSNGFSILMRVDDSPQWASNSTQFNAPPIDDNDFAEFMYQVALHFRGRVQAYEIWNEPNLAIEWGWKQPDPVKYGRMLKALYPRVKQADVNATVVTGGLSTSGDGIRADAYGDLLYLANLYDPNLDGDPSDGAKGYFDAIGSHPYGGPYPPDQDPWSPNMGTYFRRAEQHHQMAQVWGREDRQVWATEFGYLLNPATDGLSCDFGSHFSLMMVSEQQQADYLVGAFQYARANWPWMGPMFVMSLDTSMDSFRPLCDTVRFWAILRKDGSPRPAYTKLANMIASIPPSLTLSTSEVVVMARPSEENIISQQATIGNNGAGTISWTASTSAGWLGASPASGTAPSTLTITVNKAGLPLGWTTGSVTINSNAGSQTIPVRVFVGDVRRLHLPAVMRSSNG